MPSRQSTKLHHAVFGITGPLKGELLTHVSHTGVYKPVVCTVTKEIKYNVSATLGWIILVFSMVANVVLGACLISHGVSCITDIDSGHDDVTVSSDLSGSICVSCDALQVQDPATAPLLAEVKVIELDQESKLCCLKHAEHLQTLLNLVVGEYYHYGQGDTQTEDFSLRPSTPAAHLYLQRDRTPADRLLWDSETGYGTAHVTGGVVYKNGSLHVPQNGVYFLYSHLTTTPAQSDSDHDLIHCIRRYNSHLPQIGKQLLLMSKMTHGVDAKRTSFLGANLKLRKGDQIFVEFSDTSLIYNFPPANFFGLHLL